MNTLNSSKTDLAGSYIAIYINIIAKLLNSFVATYVTQNRDMYISMWQLEGMYRTGQMTFYKGRLK